MTFSMLKPFNPYSIKDGMLLVVKSDKTGERELTDVIGRVSQTVELRTEIETGSITNVIEFDYHGERRRTEIARGQLSRSKMGELANVGIDIGEHNYRDVLHHLALSEADAKKTFCHSRLGFGKVNDKQVFKHYQIKGIDSTYIGSLQIKPTGTEEEYRQLLEEHVFGHAPLELALAIGFSAPVASLLDAHLDTGVLLVHLFGNSSTGKTTAARLAVSPFGCPTTGKTGLLKTWNATTNAMQGLLVDNHGIPMVFDEASMLNRKSANLVYLLAGGVEKEKLNKESVLRAPKRWSGTFLSTGEHSLLAQGTKNIGVQVRLLEFSTINWTKSAEHADAIKDGLMKNYAQFGTAFAEMLLSMNLETLIEIWKKNKGKFLESMEKKDQFAERLADKASILLTTAELANEMLGLKFNVEEISSLICQSVVGNVEERDLGRKAYEIFLQEAIQNQIKFSRTTKTENMITVWGRFLMEEEVVKEIYVLQEIFKEIMKKHEFEDIQVILQEWRERGWLDSEKSRLTKKKQLGQVKMNMYSIRIIEEFLWDSLEKRFPTIVNPTQVVKTGPTGVFDGLQ